MSAEIGGEVSHGAVYSWVQKSGQRWQAVFEDGEAFEGESDEKETEVSGMDATTLHSQEKGRRKPTVKLGII